MLRSVALCCAPRSIGVILTGALGDGASGLCELNRCGGISVVQDPGDAVFPEMPRTALNRARPDHVVPLNEMPALLDALVRHRAGEVQPILPTLHREVEIAKTGTRGIGEMDRVGRRSVLSCPDCGGVMWEIDAGGLTRFRCPVGHAYTAEVMSLAMDENLRRALAAALRGYEERVALMLKMREQALGNGHHELAGNWQARADEYREQAAVIAAAISRLERAASQSANIA
jgi:two-component system chemotaxis response regulator CheB